MVLAAGLGGLAFAFLGGAGAALALASRRGGLLIALIVLPLLTPPVIFGGAAIENFQTGLPWITPLAMLAAYALAAAALTPFAMAAACRNALS
jgi:heme exporter protein B